MKADGVFPGGEMRCVCVCVCVCVNKSVTKYIFPYSSFHAEHDGGIYVYVQQFLWKLEGLLKPHLSLFIPPPYPVLSQYIPFYEVRWNIKRDSL